MELNTNNNREQAKDIIRSEVKQKSSESSFMPICRALVRESRERGECSTESRSHQQSPTVVFVISCPREDIAHDNAAQNVNDERAVWKTVMMGKLRREVGDQKPSDCADDSSCHHI